MRGLEVDAAVVELVVLDDDEAGDGGEQRDVVERRVGVGALFLLLGGVRGLQDEDALDEEEEGGGVEELGLDVSSGGESAGDGYGAVLPGVRRRASSRC